MGMVVRTNTMAMNAYRGLSTNQSTVAKSLEKLSSGFRINRAGDDAAGLAISEKMKAQIKGLEQASSNSQDGISLVQTAEGALTEVHNMLNRMVELATKSANGTIQNKVDREAIQNEVNAMTTEITRISKSTNFNGINLLDGSLSGASISATDGSAGTVTTAAKAAVYTFATTGMASAGLTAKVDDVALTWDTDATTTLGNFVTAYNGTAGKDYTASLDGDKIVLTAKTAGAIAGDGPAAAPAGSGNLTTGTAIATAATEKTAGADEVRTGASAGKTVIDLTNNATEGMTIDFNGKKYEFVKAGGTAAAGSTAVNVGADSKASLDNLFAKLDADKGTAYTIAQDGTSKAITITNASATDNTKALAATVSGGGLILQVGDTSDSFNKVSVSVDDLSAKGLNLLDAAGKLDVSTQDTAGNAIQTIKDAINKVSTNRGNMGAVQNRLEYTINNLDTATENMTAANSRIRDTDMAKEMMNYTKMNILTQAAQAMLAQANQQPQAILQLLQ